MFIPPHLSLPASPFLFHPRQLVMSGLTALWAARLGTYLYSRIGQLGKDSRIEHGRMTKSSFFAMWLAQALWISVTALPVYMVNAMPAKQQPQFGYLDYAGIAVWMVGFLMETVADLQKSRWHRELNAKKHDEAFIHTGLWSISRHPNYVGEIVLHVGNLLMAVSAIRGSAFFPPWAVFVAAAGPFLEYLMIRFVTGVPTLEKQQQMKNGARPEWLEYTNKVPIFFPRLSGLHM